AGSAVLDCRIVHFVIKIQLLIVPDDVRDVGDDFDALSYERTGCFPNVDGLQLGAEQNRTDFYRGLFQLRNDERAFERSHLAAGIFSNGNLHGESAWRQRCAGAVEHLMCWECSAGW